MKKTMTVSAMILAIAVAGDGLAQQHRGRGGAAGPGLDLDSPVTIHGEVVSFGAGRGGRAAILTVLASGEERALVLGPMWNIQEQGFAAETGDRVVVQGFSCGDCRERLAVASVENLTRNVILTLRGDDGAPLWQAGRGSRSVKGRGGKHEGAGPRGELGETAVYLGSVRSFSGVRGEGQPTLVLATAAGDFSIVVGPLRRLNQAGFEIVPGMALEVTAASAPCGDKDHLVAVAVKDPATGSEVVLRGHPRGGKNRRGGRG